MAKRVNAVAVKTIPRPRVLVGTGSELRNYFQETDAHGIAVIFQNEEQSSLFAPVIQRIVELLPVILESRTEQKINKLIDALLPNLPLSDR